jgi:protein disulfide-isomerase A1
MLDYYTQWGGPCKVMAPNYEQLADLYASDATGRDRVAIAKIDAEANNIPGDIGGFPTFKLFPAGSQELPMLNDGPWTIEGFADFVRDNGKHKVDFLLKNKTSDLTIEGPTTSCTLPPRARSNHTKIVIYTSH